VLLSHITSWVSIMALVSFINSGDSQTSAKNKILSVIGMDAGYDQIPTSDIVGDTRTELNSIAVANSLPSIQLLDSGFTVRNKVNALISAVGLDVDLTYLYDVLKDIVIYNNQPFDPATYIACTRAGAAQAQSASGAWQSFATNVARVTDLGLLVEPAFQNVQPYSATPSNAIWTKTSLNPGSTVGGYVQMRETAISTFHRLFSPTYNIVTGTTYAQTWFVKKANRQFLVARVNRGDGSQRQVCFDLDAVTIAYADPLLTASIVKRGDAYQLKVSFVASATGAIGTTGLLTAPAVVLDNTLPEFMGETDKGFEFYCLNFGVGSDTGSPVITTGTAVTRAADVIPLPLPSGTHDLTFDVVGGTDVVLPGQSGSPNIPTNASRIISKVTGIAA
jgi:hypothetical protein